ncbi:ankyrin repeat-containing domain protein, partial [Lobosporangium transversale]
GDLETMERLIKVHPSLIDEKVGFWPYPTVLLVAARSKHALEAMKLLVKYGAALDRGDHNGITVLHLVCEQYPNPTEAIVFLTKAGADCNSRDGKKLVDHQQQRTPLHYAIQHCKEPAPVIELLLKKGADVNAQDSKKSTPLHLVLERMDNEELVQMLL